MLGFIFLPAVTVCNYFASQNVLKVQKGCKAKLKWLLITWILYLPSIVLATLLGTVYVIYAGCRKMIDPGWTEEKFELDNFNIKFRSRELRMCEIMFESNPQAILGIAIKNDLIMIIFVFRRTVSPDCSWSLKRNLQCLRPVPRSRSKYRFSDKRNS